jgi:hypothetical protein
MIIDLIGITEPGERAFIVYKDGKDTHAVTLQVHDKQVWVQAPGVVYDQANALEYASVAQLLLDRPLKLDICQVHKDQDTGILESVYNITFRRS